MRETCKMSNESHFDGADTDTDTDTDTARVLS